MRKRTDFTLIEPTEMAQRQDNERVGITIEISGMKSDPQIAVWMAEELLPDVKVSAQLRAGLVDALQDFLDRMAGIQ